MAAYENIWVTDENDLTRLVTCTMVSKGGFNTIPFGNGVRLVERLEACLFNGAVPGSGPDTALPKLLILDDGLSLVKTDELLSYLYKVLQLRVPVIVTGSLPQQVSAQFIYLTKPIAEHSLQESIQQAMDQSAGQAHESELLYDISVLESVARNNPDFVARMTQMFLEQTPLAMQEMMEALNAGDLARVSALAHRTKPSLDNMGIRCLKDVVRKVETLAKKEVPPPELPGLVHILINTVSKAMSQMMQRA